MNIMFYEGYLCFQSKVIRVMNLWQKNSVFSPAVIQPLLDLAADPTNPEVFDNGKLYMRYFLNNGCIMK